MKKIIPVLMFLGTVFSSCKQEVKPRSLIVLNQKKIADFSQSIESQTQAVTSGGKYLDTEYVYVDPEDKPITVENSLPKGGLKYTASSGEEYVYAVFWTRITNETEYSIELTIDFPVDSYELPSAAERYFRVLIPAETMTIDKEPLFNYGIDVELFLKKSLYKPSSLRKTINPQSSNRFYFVVLVNNAVDGVVRAGLSIKGQKLFYTFNDKEIHCGKIILKN